VAETIAITINNWEKYNPRTDVKNTNWFRAQNSIFEDPDFFEFSRTELCFWFYLLSMASKKHVGQVIINIMHAQRVAGFKESEINGAIEKLSKIQCVAVDVTSASRARNAHDTLRYGTERNGTERTEHIAQQVERLYQEFYPRKVGKEKGMKKLAREVKTPEDLLDLERAIKNYAKDRAGNEAQYIQHFSTFAGEWRDWVDYAVTNQTYTPPIKFNQAAVFAEDEEHEPTPEIVQIIKSALSGKEL
jgi:hypothetical protein